VIWPVAEDLCRSGPRAKISCILKVSLMAKMDSLCRDKDAIGFWAITILLFLGKLGIPVPENLV